MSPAPPRGTFIKGLARTIVSIAFALTLSPRVSAQPAELIDFALEDQFGQVHQRADVHGTVVLLIGSDKGGSSFNGLWSKAIREALKDHPGYDRISELPYSNLRGVPFFLKGMIRSKFPEDPDNWVLMDWKGVLARTYEFVPKSANLLIFAPDGSLVHHASGREPDDKTLEKIVAELRSLLDAKDSSGRD